MLKSRNINAYQKRQVIDSIESSMDRSIFQREDGTWANKRNDLPEETTLHDSRQSAVEAATLMLQCQGGGELVVFGKGRRIISFGTIPGPEGLADDP